MNNVKPFTRKELDQQKVWAEEFETWWEREGQYHRAGGTEYCKTFAWWSWLNREQVRQVEISELTHFNDNQYKSITDRDLEIKKLSELICKLLEDNHTYMRPSIARECIVAVGWNP